MPWHAIAKTDDCPAGEARELVVAGRIVALFNVDGEYFALDGICPHQGGPLGKGYLQGCIVTCPWHGFQFDVRTGEHQTTPNLRQPTFPLKVEEDTISIELNE